jgi:hypothetical protein
MNKTECDFKSISPITFKRYSPTPTEAVSSRDTSRPLSALTIAIANYNQDNVIPSPINQYENKDEWDIQRYASSEESDVWRSLSSHLFFQQPTIERRISDESDYSSHSKNDVIDERRSFDGSCYSYHSKDDGMDEPRSSDENCYSYHSKEDSLLELFNNEHSFLGKMIYKPRAAAESSISDITTEDERCKYVSGEELLFEMDL